MRGLKARFNLKTLLLCTVIAAVSFGWWRDHRQLTAELSKYVTRVSGSWGTVEATGQPNTVGAGDIPTAWASATQDGQKEWLLLTYPKAVRAQSVVIHETYNPGAVFKVTVFRKRRQRGGCMAGQRSHARRQ